MMTVTQISQTYKFILDLLFWNYFVKTSPCSVGEELYCLITQSIYRGLGGEINKKKRQRQRTLNEKLKKEKWQHETGDKVREEKTRKGDNPHMLVVNRDRE